MPSRGDLSLLDAVSDGETQRGLEGQLRELARRLWVVPPRGSLL